MSQSCPIAESDGLEEMSQSCPKVLSDDPEAVRKRAYRERQRQVALEVEVEREVFKVAVLEFSKLNEGLQAERAILHQNRPALDVGLQVVADPILHKLVRVYQRSEVCREQLQKFVSTYRA